MDARNLTSWQKVRTYKTTGRILSSILALSLIVITLPVFAADGTTDNVPKGTYSNFLLPTNSKTDLTKVEYVLYVEDVTADSNYFYANQFGITNGDGGYIGIQEKGSRVNGTVGKTAVFSIFGAGIEASPTSNCSVETADRNFDGYTGKEGTSCRIPFAWQKNIKYSLVVQRTRSDATGSWWSGTIINRATDTSTLIAEIKVPATWKGLKSFTTLWTEYFGPHPTTCANLAYSRVRFLAPIVNEKVVTFSSNKYSTLGTCDNSNIRIEGNSYIQEMGGKTQPPTTQPPVTEPPRTEPPATSPNDPEVPVTRVDPPVTITVPPTIPPTKDVLPPQNIKTKVQDCVLFWCSVVVSWDPSAVKGAQYTLTPRGQSPMTISSTSMKFPQVLRWNTYSVDAFTSANGVRSSTTTFTVKLN